MRNLPWSNYVWILEVLLWGIGITRTDAFLHDHSNQFPSIPSRSILGASKRIPQYRGYLGDGHGHDDDDNDNSSIRQRAPERSTDRPTETLLGVEGPAVAPSKPKIVVLGATGRIGRLVVRQLLEMESIDMTVVAFVRDYDKAIRVLYDDMLVANTNPKGPKLQIVEGDLFPQEELPGYQQAIHDQDEEQLWLQNAQSAAKYFGNQVQDYDNRELLPDSNEALEEALKGCSAVISCLGSFRPTNLWTDLLARPLWRLLRPDVSRWCTDGRHPYYVHYTSTRKALGYVEREQRRREAAMAVTVASSSEESTTKHTPHVPRIRYVRISDLSVAQKPWHFVPWVTNVVQSVVLRYHEMAERLLESSSIVETVILRPGDLVDEERDVNTTSLQVCHTGAVPLPARVGREDVASLAVAAVMFQTPTYDDEKHYNWKNDKEVIPRPDPFHYTLACRWVGQHMDPFPAQGVKADGCPDAVTALRKSLKLIAKNEKRQRALQRRRKTSIDIDHDDRTNQPLSLSSFRRRKRKPQPHALCVAVPVYIMMGLFARTLLQSFFPIVLPKRPTILEPIAEQCHQWFWMMVSLLLGKFIPLRKQYISF